MSDCELALRKAASLHVDECEAVHVRKKITTVRITDSEIAELKQNIEEGTGVRLVHQKKILSAASSGPVADIVEKALQSGSPEPKNFWKSLPHPQRFSSVDRTYDRKLEEVSGKEAADIAQSMIDAALHQKITRISGSLNIVYEDFEVANSTGLYNSDKATYVSGTINTDSEFGSVPVSGIGAMSCRTMGSFSPSQVGAEARDMCVESINPRNCEPDSYSVIFSPYAIGEMLAFVFSSNFSLRTYSEKRSCFSEKLGKQIAVEGFDLIDNPHLPDGVGSKPFDDEGVPTKPRHLIQSGIFANAFSDSFYAFKEGTDTTGNASRMGNPMGRSPSPIPSPSTHNLTIPNGGRTVGEMVKDTRKGLLVGRLWYTYLVNPERGDFSCTARSGIRIIENGKIVGAGKPVRIVHNLPVLLQNIAAVGSDTRNVLQWSAIPCATPSVKANEIRAAPI